MARKRRYVVTLYNSSHCVHGVFGPFYDWEAAKTFAAASGLKRSRIHDLLSPKTFLFNVKDPPPKKRGGGTYD